MMAFPGIVARKRNRCLGPAGVYGGTTAASKKRTDDDEIFGGLIYSPGPTVPSVTANSVATGTVTVWLVLPVTETDTMSVPLHAYTDRIATTAKVRTFFEGSNAVSTIRPPQHFYRKLTGTPFAAIPAMHSLVEPNLTSRRQHDP